MCLLNLSVTAEDPAMDLYLPVAHVTLGMGSLLALGLGVGVLSGLFGVGGGFISVPLLMFMGVPPAVAIASQSAQLVGSNLTGYIAYARRGEVDDAMAVVLASGGLIGGMAGALALRVLRHYGWTETAIPLIFIFVIGCVGLLMLFESLRTVIKRGLARRPRVIEPWNFPTRPFRTYFAASHLSISYLVPAGVGFIAGIFVALMGVGGGFFLVPVLIYAFGMAPRLVTGTCFLALLLTSMVSVMLHAVINHAVDPVLALVLLAGSLLGTQMGARLSTALRGEATRLLMALLLIAVAAMLALQLMAPPDDLYALTTP